ncbi:MAG: hypothetical protein AAF328_07020 [Planctomycetota bacterium]
MTPNLLIIKAIRTAHQEMRRRSRGFGVTGITRVGDADESALGPARAVGASVKLCVAAEPQPEALAVLTEVEGWGVADLAQ